MPGLSQLKKFNSDILSLGNEPELRAKRGEKVVSVPMPKGIKDEDDSNDFVMGMPEPVNNGPKQKAKEEPEDFSDIMGTSSSSSSASASGSEAPSTAPGITLPDLSSIIAPPTDEGESAAPDLSMFDVPEEEPEPVLEKEPEQKQIDEFSLDELLGGAGFDGSEGIGEEDSSSSEDTFGLEDYSSESSTDSASQDSSADLSSDLSSGRGFSSGNDNSFDSPKNNENISDFKAPSENAGADGLDSINTASESSLPSLEEALNPSSSSSGSSMPSLEEALSSGEAPSFEETVPSSDQTSISRSQNVPPSKETAPATDDELLSGFMNGASSSQDGIEDLDAMDFAPGDSFSLEDFPELKDGTSSSEGLSDISEDSFGEDQLASPLSESSSEDLKGDVSGASSTSDVAFDTDGLPPIEDFSLPEESSSNGASDDFSLPDDSSNPGSEGDFSLPETGSTDADSKDDFSLSEVGLGEDFSLPEDSSFEGASSLSETGSTAGNDDDFALPETGSSSTEDFGLPEGDFNPPEGDFSLPDESSSSSAEGDFSLPEESSSNGASDDFSLPDDSSNPGSEGDFSLPETGSTDADSKDDFSLSEAGLGEDFSLPEDSSFEGASSLSETGSTAGNDDDFALPETGSSSTEDFGLPEGDFNLPEGDFSLPDGGLDSDNALLGDALSKENASEESDNALLSGALSGLGDLADLPSDDFSTDNLSLSDDELLKQAETPDSFVESDFGSGEKESDAFGADTLDSPFGEELSLDGLTGTDSGSDISLNENELSTDSIDMSPGIEMDDVPSIDSSEKVGDGLSLDDGIPSDYDFNMDDLSDDVPVSEFEEGPAPEAFDISAMEGLEFPDTDAQINSASGDFEFSAPDSMAMENGDFEIPGYTGDNILDEKQQDKLRQKPVEVETQGPDELPPNTLSDEQYKVFLNNLSCYPLNVRIALEDLIVKNEFTDDAEFEIISKVLKKVPARNLAAELEKMLDIPISVPRDFEKRTAEEYEAYKSSFQYQLRNRIIPAFILGTAGLVLCVLLFLFTRNFIYRPLVASSLYKQGYVLLESEDYPQSEIKFNEALRYKVKKPWFYKYAEGYRNHKQYIRAEQMYNSILQRFKHEKKAGLDYARMELDDLANYPRAEEILLREVLDNYINDPDGLLLLGDTYLEWATEKDPSKFEDARVRYVELLQLYGGKSLAQNILYKGRLMRYFVRMDNLKEVLQLKESFMHSKKSLDSADWTELSGYLLEKLYGPLHPNEEYLRTKIEDVKDMLMRAVKSDETNPVALYNLGKYYVYMNNGDLARSAFNRTVNAFKNAEKIKKRDMYKYIDAYRLYGEQYVKMREYLKAMEQYTSGIALYQKEHDASGLEGDKKIGKLYQDMGDIDYFISGNMESALHNYRASIDTENDLPEIRYKVGYINYNKQNYTEALLSFMKAGEDYPDDMNLLLSMGNSLSLKDDNFASMGYYQHLLEELSLVIQQKNILYPQSKPENAEIVDSYMKANNNLGVTLYRLAKRTGSSRYNASAMVSFQESLRSWDTLTRNQATMERLPGSNLAEQNLKYISHPMPDFEPAIYTDIPKTLYGEDILR